MNYSKLETALGKSRLKHNEPLFLHTYFKIGGPADIFFEATTTDDLIRAVKLAHHHHIPFFILGGGSNILIGDKGFRGLIIKNRADSVRTVAFQGKITALKPQVNQALVEADSGTLLNKLVRYTIEENLQGLESFLSVPGTVGGAIYNNSHYRPEKNEFVGKLLHSATLIDKNGDLKEVDYNYFKFKYDYSILHETHEVIIKTIFALQGGNRDQLWEKATECVRRRNERQPIGIACSGCTFRNISQADAIRLATPNYTQSAGYLIDQARLKGTQVGKARISSVHASFIENTGGATAQDVLALIEKIKFTVLEKFGIKLELEIFLVGEF